MSYSGKMGDSKEMQKVEQGGKTTKTKKKTKNNLKKKMGNQRLYQGDGWERLR